MSVTKALRVGSLEFNITSGSKFLVVEQLKPPTAITTSTRDHEVVASLDIREVDALRDFLGNAYSELFEPDHDAPKAKETASS